MKKIGLAALTAVLMTSGSAYAADVYQQGGGLKDESPAEYRNNGRGGFYIKGDLGIANINRDASVNVDREVGLDAPVPDSDGDGDIDDVDKDALSASLDAASIPHRFGDSDNVLVPLIGDRLNGVDGVDLDTMTFGGEVSYLFHRPSSRFGFEIGLGITGYSDAESSHGYLNENGKLVSGTLISDNAGCAGIGACAGDESPFTQSGAIKFDRDFDIDLIGRVHYFATDRLALNVGGGVSWARGNITAANLADNAFLSGLDTSMDEDVSSIGFVLTAGATYWITNNITFGFAYDYKQHTFDADASAADSVPLGGGASIYGISSHNVEVEDQVHTLKARLGVKLGSDLPSLD
jgi:opacity protein-like surface antigen